MSDIDIRITGARGVGKTTFTKFLYGVLANTGYYVEDVEDSNSLDQSYITDPRQLRQPIIRAPRSISIEIVEATFDADTDVLEDDED